jgi:flagellar biosynthesis protein FlhG
MTTQLDTLRRFVAERGAPAPASPGAAATSRVLVVGGGKGGVGTSVVAALLALASAGEGHSTLLVDGDETGGRMHLLFGAEPKRTLASLQGASPEDALTFIAPTLSLIAGDAASSAPAIAATSAERRVRFRRVAALHDRFDLVVIDGGSRLDSVMAACEAGASRLLAVTVAESIALAATYALIKVAGEQIAHLPVEVIVNRYDPRSAAHSYERIAAAAAHFLDRRVPFAGAIPDDPSLQRGLAAGLWLPDVVAGSAAALAAHATCNRLMTEIDAAAQSDERPVHPNGDLNS